MVATFSPKNRNQKRFSPDRDLSNTATVDSAKAIERAFPLSFLFTAYSEKNIFTRIYPINVSASCKTLKSTDFYAK